MECDSKYKDLIRAASLLFLSWLAMAGGLCVRSYAAGEAPAEKKEEKAKTTFSPEVETKFAEFLVKLKEAKRKVWVLRMKKEIEDIAKVTGLNAEGMAALDTVMQQPIDECMKDWLVKLEDLFRQEARQAPAQMMAAFDQLLPQIDEYAKADFVPGALLPMDHTAWTEALARTLTGEQAAAWKKVLTERKEAFQKEIGDTVKRMADITREQLTKTMLAKCGEIQRTLGLSKERAEALDVLARNAVQKSTEAWQKRAETWLASMEEKQRRQIAKTGQVYLAPDPNDIPEQQAVWKDGIAKVLTPDELKSLEGAKNEHRSRRIRAMSRIMLVELDQKVAFTASQRDRLQPIAERLVNQPSLFPEQENGNFDYGFSPSTLFAAGTTATEEEMTPILDRVQWAHWKEACDPKNAEVDPDNPMPQNPKPQVVEKKPSKPAEPEDFEGEISNFLHERTLKERKKMLTTMILKAEDAGRVAALPVGEVDRLKSAARGATEEALIVWKKNTDETIRQQVRDATAQNVKQRLANIQEYNFQRNSEGPEKLGLWEKTVKTEMTAEQQAKWKKEVDDRNEYRNKSIASFILAQFDHKNPLSNDQWEKLEPMISTIANDYAPEIASYFSYNNGSRWYLQSYSMFIPLVGIPEKDLKAILTTAQWDQWVGSNEFANGSNYWGTLQQIHGQRVKAKKP